MAVDPLSEQHEKAVWDTFGRALGAEPRNHPIVRGFSGLDHTVEAISVDDKNGRVIVFAAEPNPRIAALMQVDIQQTMPDVRVLVARPIAFDASSFARRFVELIGQSEINLSAIVAKAKEVGESKEAETLPSAIKELLTPFMTTFKKVELPSLNQILAFIQQAALFDWSSVLRHGAEKAIIPLQNLLALDSMADDRRFGICPIPLYEFTERDWELLLSGTAVEEIKERLKALGIYQYFFPAPDQTALGMVERTGANLKAISSALELAPKIGHPLGVNEIVLAQANVSEMIQTFSDAGLVVEGEMNWKLTEKGIQARSAVKFRPREGFLTKLMQSFRATVNVNANLDADVNFSSKDFTG